MSARLVLFIAVITAILATMLAWTNLSGAWGDTEGPLRDFRAFYCSGIVARSGHDPYRAEPLGACERAIVAEHLPAGSQFVVPAPLPSYAIASFVPVTLLPYRSAATIWIALLAVNFVFLFWACARLTQARPLVVFIALLPLGLMIPLKLGQFVPLAVSSALAGALALRASRPFAAGLLVAATLVEPHLGVGACIATAVFAPRARLGLGIGVLGLALLGFTVLGVGESIEYVKAVVPAQILAEIDYDDQFSTAYLLRWIGAPVAVAIWLAHAGYWLVTIGSAFVAARMKARFADDACIVVVPLGASVFLGPYLHAEHLLAAVPLALWIAGLSEKPLRAVAWIALAAIAWPLKWLLQVAGVLPAMYLYGGAPPAYARGPNVLVQIPWQLAAAPQTGHLDFLLAKIATWAGLAILALLVLQLARTHHVALDVVHETA